MNKYQEHLEMKIRPFIYWEIEMKSNSKREFNFGPAPWQDILTNKSYLRVRNQSDTLEMALLRYGPWKKVKTSVICIQINISLVAEGDLLAELRMCNRNVDFLFISKCTSYAELMAKSFWYLNDYIQMSRNWKLTFTTAVLVTVCWLVKLLFVA